jgi:hypothetical protein
MDRLSGAIILLLIVLNGCHNNAQNDQEGSELEIQNDSLKSLPEFQLTYPEFNTTTANLPFHLDKPQINTFSVVLPPPILQNFKSQLKDNYLNFGGDSTETYFTLADLYVNSYLSVVDDKTHIYLMITESPTSFLSSYIICFNPLSKAISTDIIQTDLTWTYDYNGENFALSELYKSFGLNEPFIEITDIDNDGKNEIKLSRLAHNGTAFTCLDQHIYEMSDSNIKPIFSYSKMEFLSLDDAKITREFIPTESENLIRLAIFITENAVKTEIGTVDFYRANKDEPYSKNRHQFNNNLTSEQQNKWGKLCVSAFSHEI